MYWVVDYFSVLQATLGKGKNGVVYVAELTSGEVPVGGASDETVGAMSRSIVVKKVPLSHKKKRAKQQVFALRDEIDSLVSLSHGNVVKYFGWNIEQPNEDVNTDQQQVVYFRIFMEFCAGNVWQRGINFNSKHSTF